MDNTNTGALFHNDKQGNENRPDYRGNINVDGVDYRISAWLKTSKTGIRYMSLSVQPQTETYGKSGKPDHAKSAAADYDEIPF